MTVFCHSVSAQWHGGATAHPKLLPADAAARHSLKATTARRHGVYRQKLPANGSLQPDSHEPMPNGFTFKAEVIYGDSNYVNLPGFDNAAAGKPLLGDDGDYDEDEDEANVEV